MYECCHKTIFCNAVAWFMKFRLVKTIKTLKIQYLYTLKKKKL